jgi:hypothetical protein
MRLTAVATALALLFLGGAANANSIVTRCKRLTAKQSAELEARAALTLSTLERRAGAIVIECDDWVSALTWFDGSRRKIDEGNGLVEGALDAIEEQAAQGARTRGTTAPVHFGEDEAPSVPPPAPAPSSRSLIEGGIGLAMTAEPWLTQMGFGPRLDFGVTLRNGLAFVGSEGVRFGTSSGNNMVFDLQGGFALGAPYSRGQGLGFTIVGGAERFSGSGANDTLRMWTGFFALGGRAAIRSADFELWAGLDLMTRFSEFATGGPHPFAISTTTGLFSLGGFWAAWPFAHDRRREARR